MGNLRSRSDLALLEELVAKRPSWTFVVIGSLHGSSDILRLRAYPNLRLLGPKIYEDALDYMRCFDVAIMLGRSNAISKDVIFPTLYVYAALGIPVIATNRSITDDLRTRIELAGTSQEFLAKLDSTIARHGVVGPNRPPPPDELWPICWQKRAADFVDLCRQSLEG